MNTPLSKEEIVRDNRLIERCSGSLAPRDMKIRLASSELECQSHTLKCINARKDVEEMAP